MKRFFILFLIGTAVFAALLQFTMIGFLLSSIAGIGVMIALGSVFKLFDRATGDKAQTVTLSEKAAGDVVKEGMEKLRQISNCTRMIQSNEVAGKIREICKIGVEIFDDIKKKPNDLKKAKQFTNYYLDATKKIIEQYAELSGKTKKTPDVEKTIAKIEGMLDSIKETFERQLAGLLEDDLLDINAELSVLKNTMKME